jgi:predicted dehydrogenase
MSEPRSLRIAMIGGGFMGKAHALAYAALPMFFWPPPAMPTRAVLVDADADLAAEAARRYGFERSSADWRAVVADPDVDIVDIVTPNHLHAAMAIAAAEAGKHVICEKPLARSGDEALTMLEAVEKAGVTHMVAFNYRRTPAAALARKLVDEGAVGEVISFRGTYLQDCRPTPTPRCRGGSSATSPGRARSATSAPTWWTWRATSSARSRRSTPSSRRGSATGRCRRAASTSSARRRSWPTAPGPRSTSTTRC